MRFLFLFLLLNAFAFAEVFDDGKFLQPLSRLSLNEIEISAYSSLDKKLYGIGGKNLYEIDLSKPETPALLMTKDLGEVAASIAIFEKTFAIAFPGNGTAGLLRLYTYEDSLVLKQEFKTCPGLDMVTFTPDGKFLLGACEGAPADDNSSDPEGAVLLLSVEKMQVQLLQFSHLDSTKLIASGVRTSGPASFFKSLEPEYITISEDSRTAYVSLQENNAIAKIDIPNAKISEVFGLGTLDHSQKENAIVVRKGEKIIWDNLPLLGLRQPDGIALFQHKNNHFIITANEGADMDYSFWKDALKWKKRIVGENLDKKVFTPEIEEALSDIKLSKDACKKNSNGECEAFYSYGTRSISLFDGKNGKLIWDSGSLIEKKMKQIAPKYFNWNSKKGKVKVNARSNSKGSEPENVVVGEVSGKLYAFVALERMSGIIVFELKNGENPQYKAFFMDSQDRGPEGLLFIPKEKSPIKTPLLVVSYEYGGSLVIYSISEK